MRAIQAVLCRLPLPALAAVALGVAASPAQAQTPLSFYPVTPCRLWDTRQPNGPQGGPKLNANSDRDFPVKGFCGVPATAVAAALNLTVVGATDLGDIRAFPQGTTMPNASVLNYLGDGVAIANGAILMLGSAGTGQNMFHITIHVDMPAGSTGQVHSLADVNGYFQ
jgi:hypothetical protein